jgi:hypothetical protein
MARVLPLALLLSLATPLAHAEVRVEQRGNRVDLAVTRAPVADVLDRIARQTGMKVVYDGPPPRQLVTMSVRDRTQAEAVLAVLEGLGLNYALLSDPSGTRVETLMVAGRTTTAAAAAPTPTPQPAAAGPARFGEPNSHRPYTPPGGAPVDIPPDEAAEDNDAAGPPTPPEATNPPQGPIGAPPANTAPQQPQAAPPIPVAPPQMFPVSPFAPQAPAAPTPAPGASPAPAGRVPAQNPGAQPTPPQTQ